MGFRLRLILMSAGLSACSSTPLVRISGEAYTDKTEFMAKIPSIKTSLLVANLVIEEKRFKFELDGTDPMPVDMVKARALSHAVLETGADVVVEPLYEVEATELGYRVIISGYPARYVRIRTGTPMDKKILRVAAGTAAAEEGTPKVETKANPEASTQLPSDGVGKVRKRRRRKR